jgi:hypothetical protein
MKITTADDRETVVKDCNEVHRTVSQVQDTDFEIYTFVNFVVY